MSHRFRVSASMQENLLTKQQGSLLDLEIHITSCDVCDDEHGICGSASNLLAEIENTERQLKIIGVGKGS